MSEAREAPRTAKIGWIAWTDAPALVAFTLYFLGQPRAKVDDAFIFYRYAANWAAGLGPVFNPGEHVEGFSSDLWTAMLAVAARLGWAPHRAGPALGFACTAVTLLLLGHATRRAFPGRTWLHVLVPLGTAFSAGVIFYAASGMDTPLFAAVLLASALAAVSAIEHDDWRALAVCVPLLALVRAEGPVYVGLLIACVLPAAARRGSASLLRWAGVATLAAASIAALFAVRAAYFGDVLPASMRSKAIVPHTWIEIEHHRAHAHDLVVLLARGVRHELLLLSVLALPVMALVICAVRRRPLPALMVTLLLIVLLTTTIGVVAAGDWMPYHRHSAAVWGMGLLLLAWSGVELGGRYAGIVSVLALLAGAWRGAEGVPRMGNPLTMASLRSGDLDLSTQRLGTTLAGLQPQPVVVSNIIGEFAYAAGPRVYVRDALGLTDAHNSHFGEDWFLNFGRTDERYTFGTPCDVVISNRALDLVHLLQYARDAKGTPRPFVLQAAPGWLEQRYFVATAAGSPATGAVARLAGTAPVPLDSSTTAVVQRYELSARGWALAGLPAAVAAAHGDPFTRPRGARAPTR